MRVLRQVWFHLRQISTTTYLLQLMIMGTLSACFIQRLGAAAWGIEPYIGFVRSFIIGVWTACTAAAGILGFERRKGTLLYLANSRSNPLLSLAAVVAATGTYGLLAFPLSLLLWMIPGSAQLPVSTLTQYGTQLIIGLVGLWLSAVVTSFVIASIFILTPNAIAYEGLLLVPLLFISGVFMNPDSLHMPMITFAQWFIPSLASLQILYAPYINAQIIVHILATLCGCTIWLLIAWALGRRVLHVARQDATLELV